MIIKKKKKGNLLILYLTDIIKLSQLLPKIICMHSKALYLLDLNNQDLSQTY